MSNDHAPIKMYLLGDVKAKLCGICCVYITNLRKSLKCLSVDFQNIFKHFVISLEINNLQNQNKSLILRWYVF